MHFSITLYSYTIFQRKIIRRPNVRNCGKIREALKAWKELLQRKGPLLAKHSGRIWWFCERGLQPDFQDVKGSGESNRFVGENVEVRSYSKNHCERCAQSSILWWGQKPWSSGQNCQKVNGKLNKILFLVEGVWFFWKLSTIRVY